MRFLAVRIHQVKPEWVFFDTPVALLAEIEEIFAGISITEGAKVFEERKDRLKRYIGAEGEYLSNDECEVDFLFTRKAI
jgi:hypothetical protein